ncbi:helix-turn-helix transcriptional regulator [Jeotgalibaca porci]|uniref:helix-turn-helix transcriptional regulator n=1 Tax=Jeotgalibaca porci TaxID=1868793 RepID=UPI00359F8744
METTKVSSYISRRRAKDKSFDEAFIGESERLEVAVALRSLRAAEGLTQRQLAEKVEKPQSTIARIENGNMNVTFKTMNDIAKAFDKVIEVKFV